MAPFVLMVLGVAIVGIGLALVLNIGGAADKEAKRYRDRGFAYQLWRLSGDADRTVFQSSTTWRWMGGGYCVMGTAMWLFAILIARSHG